MISPPRCFITRSRAPEGRDTSPGRLPPPPITDVRLELNDEDWFPSLPGEDRSGDVTSLSRVLIRLNADMAGC